MDHPFFVSPCTRICGKTENMMPENTDAIDTNSIPRLISAARREFLIRQSRTPENVKWLEEDGTPVSKDEWSGKQMQGKCRQ